MKILNKLKWSGCRGKLFIIFAGGTSCTVILLTILWLTYAWKAVQQSVHRDIEIIASKTAGELDQYLSGKTDTLMAVRELLSYPDEDRFKLGLMLKRIDAEFNHFDNLALLDASNRLIVAGTSGGNQSVSMDVLDTVKKGKIYRSPMLFTENNLPYLKIVVPIFWQGEVFRILAADLNVMPIWSKVDDVRIGKTGRASILSEDGLFLADMDKSRILNRQNIRDFISMALPSAEKSGVLNIHDHKGISLDLAYAEMPSTGWRLVITQEHKESMHFLNYMVYNALIVLLILLPGAYYMASWLSRMISEPIEELHKGMQEVINGNLDYKVPKLSGDEMSALGEGFNAMSGFLREKKMVEKKLATAERLTAVGRLAADVAHEINNPLAIMKNYIYIISKKKMKEDDPNQQYLKIIDGEIDRVARIIRSFNEFYKGIQTVSLEETDLMPPLEEVLAFCRVDLEGKGITLEERIADSGKVMADKDKLKQVFLNLIKNAVEAMPEGGRVTVETRKDDGKINISIADTGTGIKAEHLKRIFDPFFSTKGVKGTGLGLSVSYGIIKNMNGDIEVESEEGKGTTFRIVLPVAA